MVLIFTTIFLFILLLSCIFHVFIEESVTTIVEENRVRIHLINDNEMSMKMTDTLG